MMGTYSIAEIINSAWQAIVYGTKVNKIVFVVLDEGTWQKHDKKSFDAVMNMVDNIAPNNSITCYVKYMKDLYDLITM